EDNHYPVIDAQSILADRTIERALAERSKALDTASEK
ncbi:aspartate racemase, partial [Enterococcus faecium]|nr:aspartate racemase [Enterococcus faecium]